MSDDGKEQWEGDVEGSEMEGVDKDDDSVDVPAVSCHVMVSGSVTLATGNGLGRKTDEG